MTLIASLAQRIVTEVSRIVNEEVIVVNDKGTIMAASDEKRIGTFHEGACIAAKNKQQYIITKEDVSRLEGVKAGLNLPIIFENQVIGVIGITGEKEEIIRFGQLIQRMTELMIQEAYTSERLETRYRGLETFVYEWVHKEQLDKDFIERAEILGIDLFSKRMCVLMELENKEDELTREGVFEGGIAELLRSSFSDDPQDIIIRWGSGRYVLLKHMKENDSLYTVKSRLEACRREAHSRRTFMFAGGGKPFTDPSQLHVSYRDAKKALRTAKKRRGIMFYSDLSLDMALAEISDETRMEVVNKVLGPLQRDKELLDTLKMFFACDLSVKETAEQQHVHINTLRYRLKRVGELTGAPVKDTEHLVSLYLAISFLEE